MFMFNFTPMRLYPGVNFAFEPVVFVTPLIYKNSIVEDLYLDMNGDVYTTRYASSKGLRDTVSKRKYTYRAKYPCVIYRDKKTNTTKRLSVHVAVASTFKPIHTLYEIPGVPQNILKLSKNCNETLMFLYHTLQVNHIDHVRDNFVPENLEWVTAHDNTESYKKYLNHMRSN